MDTEREGGGQTERDRERGGRNSDGERERGEREREGERERDGHRVREREMDTARD